MTTKNRRAVGTLGVAAVVAVLAVSMIAMNFTSPVLAEHVPAKSGYVGGSELTVTATSGNLIEPFYFKSNSGGDILFDLTAECATMTHIKGKGKMTEFDGASVDAKVWFEWLPAGSEDIRANWKIIPIGDDISTSDPDAGKWNFCEQVFAIKTNLNDLIYSCEDAWTEFGKVADTSDPNDIYDNLRAACPSENGTTADDPFKLVFLCAIDPDETDCEQAIELFLKTAGTRPASALLMNVPNGIHKGQVMTEITIKGQDNLAGGGSCGPNFPDDCTIETALMIGKRLLIVEDIHLANDAGL